MIIRVTQEDINNGVKYSEYMCPIALAVNRAAGTVVASAGETFIHIGLRKFITPTTATSFIRCFDRGTVVQPFEFELKEEAVYDSPS